MHNSKRLKKHHSKSRRSFHRDIAKSDLAMFFNPSDLEETADDDEQHGLLHPPRNAEPRKLTDEGIKTVEDKLKGEDDYEVIGQEDLVNDSSDEWEVLVVPI
jgi:hypothetical protein